MLKPSIRNFTLTVALAAFTASSLRAATINPPPPTPPPAPIVQGVTGGDPEPTSPDIETLILLSMVNLY